MEALPTFLPGQGGLVLRLDRQRELGLGLGLRQKAMSRREGASVAVGMTGHAVTSRPNRGGPQSLEPGHFGQAFGGHLRRRRALGAAVEPIAEESSAWYLGCRAGSLTIRRENNIHNVKRTNTGGGVGGGDGQSTGGGTTRTAGLVGRTWWGAEVGEPRGRSRGDLLCWGRQPISSAVGSFSAGGATAIVDVDRVRVHGECGFIIRVVRCLDSV